MLHLTLSQAVTPAPTPTKTRPVPGPEVYPDAVPYLPPDFVCPSQTEKFAP